jgi:hypothetical protein
MPPVVISCAPCGAKLWRYGSASHETSPTFPTFPPKGQIVGDVGDVGEEITVKTPPMTNSGDQTVTSWIE